MSNNTLSDADLVTILLSKRIFDESNTSEDSDRVYKSLANLSRIRPHNSLWHLLDGDTQTDEQTWRPRVDAFVRCLESLSSMNMDLDGAVPLKIEAAGLTIDLKISILSELWLTLLPLVFWIRSLAAKANSQLDHRRHYVVGVSGPPGAGKTVISQILKKVMDCAFASESHTVFSMDAYHHYNEYLESHKMKHLKGAPETFDVRKFAHDLEKIKEQRPGGDALLLPEYDRNIHNPVEGRVALVAPTEGESVVFVEGLFLLYHSDEEKDRGWKEISKLIDLHILLAVDKEECKRRVVDRKVLGGRSREDSEAHFDRVDSVNYDKILSREAIASAHQVLRLKPDSFSLVEL